MILGVSKTSKPLPQNCTHHEGNSDNADEDEEPVKAGEDVLLVVGDGGEEGEEGEAKEEGEQGGDGGQHTREGHSSCH